jgi:hypothetical protein
MTLFTVIVFFNMNLFLVEAEALDLLKDKRMMQNIARLIAGASSEEEKDIAGTGSAEGDAAVREIDFIFSQVLFPFSAFTHISSNGYWLAGPASLLTRSTDTLCQPPEA